MTDVSRSFRRLACRGARLGPTWVMASRQTIAARWPACWPPGRGRPRRRTPRPQSPRVGGRPREPSRPRQARSRDAWAAPQDHALSPGGERDMELRRAAPLTPPAAGIPAHAPGSPVPATGAALGDALRGPEAQEPVRVVRGEEALVLGELPGDAVDHGRLVQGAADEKDATPRGRAGDGARGCGRWRHRWVEGSRVSLERRSRDGDVTNGQAGAPLPRGRAGLAPPSHLRLRRRRPRAA